jgi:hypothetical protein
MGITIKNLNFTHGRMVLASTASTSEYKTDVAHLYHEVEVGGTIDYKHNQTAADEGVIQVNLSLGSNWSEGRVVGFSSPFKKLYADYFLFNFLGKPDTSGLNLRSGDLWIKDPTTELPAGRGYFMGQGLVPWADNYYLETLDPAYSSANRSDAAKDFSFARKFAPTSLTSFVGTGTSNDAYTGEELNDADVTVTIAEGYNFLGNPFLVPISLKELHDATIPTDWGTGVDASIDNQAWVLTSGTGKRQSDRAFYFGFSYLLLQNVGATAGDTIAPMQMFVIHKTTTGNTNFTIPISKRIHGNIPFLRSETPAPVVDELLIEARDGLTGNFDRLCVVFRNGASLSATDTYDAAKIFNRTGGVNQVYTRSSDNKSLTTNVIPPSTDKIVMYLEPSNQSQEVTIQASRLGSIKSVPNAVLEDRQTGKITDFKKVSSYRYQSSPSDRADRFVLYFGSNAPTGLDQIRSLAFNANYESGSIGVYGIEDHSLGRDILVYDMLGQLIARQPITQAPYMRIEKTLSKGIYLLKIAGENTVAHRFLVK